MDAKTAVERLLILQARVLITERQLSRPGRRLRADERAQRVAANEAADAELAAFFAELDVNPSHGYSE